MNRYVKVKGHPNWFLVFNADTIVDGLNETMQQKLIRSEVNTLHNDNGRDMGNLTRLKFVAVMSIDYSELIKKYGEIIIRPSGSYMPMRGNEITEEAYAESFPVDEFGDIVICENDANAEYDWVEYLKKRFPKKKIITINFFDLRHEKEVSDYFAKAEIITFSTTFSNYEWFKKLTKLSVGKKVLGYCHDKEKWHDAIEINPTVEIVEKI